MTPRFGNTALALLTWASLGVVAASQSGCRATRCDEFVAEPNAGDYRGGGSLGDDRLLDVSLKASAKQVVLTYTGRDGSRIRAFYRVTKKSKK